MRRPTTLLAVLAAVAALSPTAAGASVGLDVHAHRSSVRQGEAFHYRVVLQNDTGSAVSSSFTTMLAPRGGAAIAVAAWRGAIPPRDRVVVERSVTPSQWFDAIGEYQLRVVAGSATSKLRFKVARADAAVPRFEEVTARAGLAAVHRAGPDCDIGAGAAWGDADGDGDLDLYVPMQVPPSELWLNDGAGGFVEAARAAGADNGGAIGMGAVFADYDNDGDQDLYVVNDGPNRLYRNDGSGSFTDVAPATGVADRGPGTSAAWADYDRDGRLDLYLTNYVRCRTDWDWTVHDDVLYHQRPDGTFADVSALLPEPAGASTDGAAFQAGWLDYDNDGDQDLYVANDAIPDCEGQCADNLLYRNDGPGLLGWRFTDMSEASGAGVRVNSMGLGLGDYDGDGFVDIAVSNMGPTVLLRNRGDGTFAEEAGAAGVARPEQRAGVMSITWGLAFADVNNDGTEDLYVGAGLLGMPGEPREQPNAMFVNRGKGRFLDLSAPSGADHPGIARGVALADYDADGLVDILVINRGEPVRLFRNVTPVQRGRWLGIDPAGTLSNRDGCGARVTVHPRSASPMMRDIVCGSTGQGTGTDSTAHFGLGSSARVPTVTIQWPSGVCQVLRDVEPGRVLRVTEPSAPGAAVRLPGWMRRACE